jgi:hypothetical protein
MDRESQDMEFGRYRRGGGALRKYISHIHYGDKPSTDLNLKQFHGLEQDLLSYVDLSCY